MRVPIVAGEMTPQFSSVRSLSRVRLCNPMDCSTPDLPVYHQLPEFIQAHAHWFGDAIQPSHHLSLPSPPAPQSFPVRVFSSELVLLIRWPNIGVSSSASVLQWILRVDFFYDRLVWSPYSRKDSQNFSSTTIQKHQFFNTQPSLWSSSKIYTWLLEKP